MRNVTDKNKKINELVKQEISRLESEHEKNTESLRINEKRIFDIKEETERLESDNAVYRSNISALEEEIDVLK